MTLTKTYEDLKKEIEIMDKKINKMTRTTCPICKQKLLNEEEIKFHIKKYKHYGDFIPDGNKRPYKLYIFTEFQNKKTSLSQFIKDCKEQLEFLEQYTNDLDEKINKRIEELKQIITNYERH